MKNDLTGKGILVLDLETAYNQTAVYSTGEQYVGHKNILQERKIICACYKWVGEDQVYTLDFGLKKQDDTELLKKLTKVINSATIILGQNSDKYDIRFIQGRLFLKQLPPIANKPTLLTLDTMKLAKSTLNLNSYSLDYFSKSLGLGGKIRMQFDDWVDILDRQCPKAFAKMLKYCAKDVRDTEKVFLKMRPYIKLPFPLYGDGKSHCPNCPADTLRRKKTIRTMPSGIRKQTWTCLGCGVSFTGDRV